MNLNNYLKEKNLNSGIIIFTLVTFVSYILTRYYYTGYFIFADLQFIVGAIIGVLCTLTNRKSNQSILKYGVIVGIAGGFISSFFITLFEWIMFSSVYGINVQVFFIYLGYICLSGIPIGLVIGALLSAYYVYRDMKEEKEEDYSDNEFFKDLIEK
ncbi:MAG: hypothetical protein ACFFDN_12740 [Candidatus Hodarchaeota archaeon]